MSREIFYNEEDKIRKLLMYRKIVKVENDILYLDNGVELEVLPNVGCLGCGAGDYSITELNGCDNAITSVEFECIETNEHGDLSYKIFVYAETREEAWNLLKDDTDIDGSGGWDYDYIQEFINNNWDE